MPRSKLDDALIESLGNYRENLLAQLKALDTIPTRQELEAEITAVDQKLAEIDPTISPIDQAALDAAVKSVG